MSLSISQLGAYIGKLLLNLQQKRIPLNLIIIEHFKHKAKFISDEACY